MTAWPANGAAQARDGGRAGLARWHFHRSNRSRNPSRPVGNGSPAGRNSIRRQHETMTTSPDDSLHKHIRVSRAQWERIERAAEGSPHSPNQVLVELAMEALDRREWPGTDTEMRVARASLFAAQVLARSLIADGREAEVQEIRDFISTIVPDPDARAPEGPAPAVRAAPPEG